MVDREKVIKGLECCMNENTVCRVSGCPYYGRGDLHDCYVKLFGDAINLLKTSFTPKEVYDTVIEHGHHDKRFKLGDIIDYSFTDVVDILNIELMCKAGDM